MTPDHWPVNFLQRLQRQHKRRETRSDALLMEHILCCYPSPTIAHLTTACGQQCITCSPPLARTRILTWIRRKLFASEVSRQPFVESDVLRIRNKSNLHYEALTTQMLRTDHDRCYTVCQANAGVTYSNIKFSFHCIVFFRCCVSLNVRAVISRLVLAEGNVRAAELTLQLKPFTSPINSQPPALMQPPPFQSAH